MLHLSFDQKKGDDDPQERPAHESHFIVTLPLVEGSDALLAGLGLRLLALGADAGQLQRVAEAGVAPFLGDLVFEALDDAFVDGFDLMAGPADQVVMVVVAIGVADFVTGGAIDPGDALDQFLFLEDGDEAEDGGEITALGADFLVNFGEGEGDGAFLQQTHDGHAPVRGPQPVLSQPRGGIGAVRVRMRVFTHTYL